MVLFNFQHFKIDEFHSDHGPFSMTLTYNNLTRSRSTNPNRRRSCSANRSASEIVATEDHHLNPTNF